MKKLITIIFLFVLISSFASAEMIDYNSMSSEQMCNLPDIKQNNELNGMKIDECIRQAKEHMMITQSPVHKEMDECVKNSSGDMEKMKSCGERFEQDSEVKKYREEESKRFESRLSEDEKNKMRDSCKKMGMKDEMCREPWNMKPRMNLPRINDSINPEDYKKMMEERKQMEQKMQEKMNDEKRLMEERMKEQQKQMEEKRRSAEEDHKRIEKESSENEQLFALLNVALKLEGLKVELIKITNKISALENFYSNQGDKASAERFKTVNSQFNGLVSKIDGIRASIKSKDAELSKEDIDGIKSNIRSIKDDLKKIIKTLVS